MNHWVPYDETRLFAMLGLDRAAVGRWLERDDIHTLAQLVRRRGLERAARLSAGVEREADPLS